MTLKELAIKFHQHENNTSMCEHYKNAWLLSNKNNFHFEKLDESDISDLRQYLKCYLLCIYEYLANQDGVTPADWFDKYIAETCNRQENDCYKALEESYITIHGENYNKESLEKSWQLMLDKSIAPFKQRGITRDCLDDSV